MEIEGVVYDRARFNGLPSIEAADAAMRAEGKLQLAYSVLAPIFARHEMCDLWALSLLHNHWGVEEGELPIQDTAAAASPRALETLPRDSFGKEFWGTTLAVSAAGPFLQPLEFSTDPSTIPAAQALGASPRFAAEVCEALAASGLDDTFGLVAIKPIAPGYDWVELNYEGRISILRETAPAEVMGKDLIQTAWRMSDDDGVSECMPLCITKCETSSTGSHTQKHNKSGLHG